MKQKQDGKGVAEYVAETEEDIEKLVTERGEGGQGIHESLEDAELKGITPEVARLAVRRPSAAGDDEALPASSTADPKGADRGKA